MNDSRDSYRIRSRQDMEENKLSGFHWSDGEREWDFSNLCLDDEKRDAAIRQTLKKPRPGTLSYEFQEPLYPKLEDVAAVKTLQVPETFNDKPKEYASKPLHHYRGDSYSYHSAGSSSSHSGRIGAFADPTPAVYDDRKKSAKPPPPTWVNQRTSHETDSKSEGSFDHESSKPSALKKSPEYYAQKPRDEVEVSPGNFMELRGSDETMEAVMNGADQVVECISCQIRLRCVPDADYVLCPDCRVLSPVPQLPEYNDDEDFYVMRSSRNGGPGSRQYKSHRVGGLGLGLKLEHDC